MKRCFLIAFVIIQTSVSQSFDNDIVSHFFSSAMRDTHPYEWADYISKQIGERPVGSVTNGMAMDYVENRLEDIGLRVSYQDFDVPKWVRGIPEYAYAETSSGERTNMEIFAMVGSTATPLKGVKSTVIEIGNFDDLKSLTANDTRGKIIFVNNDINDYPDFDTEKTYFRLIEQYEQIPELFSEHDPVAVIVRSLSTRLDDMEPHLGLVRYAGKFQNLIPVATLSNHSAEILSSLLNVDPNTQFYLRQSCRTFPKVNTKNIITTLNGKRSTDKKIVIAAHLDSWDISPGAHGGISGLVQAMGAIKLIVESGYKTNHTIELVLFNGYVWDHSGAKHYCKTRKNKIHVAIQSPNGYSPVGIRIYGDNTALKSIEEIKTLLQPYGLCRLKLGRPTTDIVKLESKATALIELETLSDRYFDIIASKNDNFDQINRRELQKGTAVLASLIYIADQM